MTGVILKGGHSAKSSKKFAGLTGSVNDNRCYDNGRYVTGAIDSDGQ
jgi:hypothetical protein